MDPHPTSSRRALLAGMLGGFGAWVAGAIDRASPVHGANGDVVTVGGTFSGTSFTQIITSSGVAFWGDCSGGTGLVGRSTSGEGIHGSSTSGAGVLGSSSSASGVSGSSSSGQGVAGFSSAANGVWGQSASASASGVYGFNVQRGYGIAGRSNAHGLGVNGVFAAASLGENTADGIGVWARSQSGVALYADAIDRGTAIALKTRGISRFDRSGKLTIKAGHASVTKTGIRIDSGSLVLATLQQDRSGIYVRSAVPSGSGDSFTVRLNKAVSADTKVGWFIVN